MDQDRTLARFFRASRYAGVAPYRSLRLSQISKPLALFSRLLFFCYGIMVLIALKINAQKSSRNLQISGAIMVWSFQTVIAVNITGILYMGMFHASRRLRHSFHYWKSVKKIIQGIGRAPTADPTERQICMLFISVQIALLVLNVADIWELADTYNSNIMITIFVLTLINSGYFVSNFIMGHFVLMGMRISSPFRAINEQLVEIASEMQSNDDRFGSTDLNKPMARINHTIDMLGKFNVGHTDKQLAHEKLRSLARAYVSTCELIRQHNSSEEILLMYLLIYTVVKSANSVYLVIAAGFFLKENYLPPIVPEIIWYLLHVVGGMLLAVPWHTIDEEEKKIY
ncbi:uncharacterized protein [Epargyreus clarus]|uniref:uncharacterized protein n=1 Tax=Epargyreus clarus TaxID=520877 RepID=UPI003C30395C